MLSNTANYCKYVSYFCHAHASNRSGICSVSDDGLVRQCFAAGYTNVEICAILSRNEEFVRCVLYKQVNKK